MSALTDARQAALSLVADLDRGDVEAALEDVCAAAVAVWDLKRQRRGLEHVSVVVARVMADLAGKARG